MGKHAPIAQSQKVVDVFVPISGAVIGKMLSAQEWHKDLLVSWLFQTCIRLQKSLDCRFLRFGMTVQEANVLLRCVEARRITPGQLAIALGRDKGKITRFIDRLESSHLVTRDIDPLNRSFSILKPTAKGKRVARDLAPVFDSIRKELFEGILEGDVLRLGKMLQRLNKNAVHIGSRHDGDPERGRKRIGSHRMKSEDPEKNQTQLAEQILTVSVNAHAADTPPIEQESHESELIRNGQSSENNITPGKLVEELDGLIVK
jgi:DNA-binding MarR family transcriptional regulator